MTTINKPRPKTRRRGNGEGSIYLRGDGRWVGSVTIGRDANGKRIRKVVYGKTKTEVQEELGKLQSSKAAGTINAPNRQTVASYLALWLATVKPNLKTGTYGNYETAIRLQVNPRIGGTMLSRVAPAHVELLYAKMADDGCTADTIRTTHGVLKMAFDRAVSRKMLARNPCEDIDRPRTPDRKIQPLTAEQVAVLLDAAKGDRFEALYVLAVASGMRIGEVFALQWGDIDFAAGAVNVQHSQCESKEGIALTATKSAKGRRRIDLPDFAVLALQEHRKRAMADGTIGAGRVFTTPIGTPLRRGNFHHNSFKPLLRRAGLPIIRFHDLRHTHACLLLLAGVHPKVVQERLGHATISMTLDTYSHLIPSMQKDAAGKLDAIMGAIQAKPGAKAVTGA